jgi:hypothetical protein
MKKFLFLPVFICLYVNANAQFASNSKQHLEAAISPLFTNQNVPDIYGDEPGQRMKRTGTALTIAGAVFFVGGLALVSQADALYYSSTTSNNGTVEQGDPKGGLGSVMVAAGVGMMVPGIIFWSKGAKKYRAYQEGQNVSISMKGAGLSLRLKF